MGDTDRLANSSFADAGAEGEESQLISVATFAFACFVAADWVLWSFGHGTWKRKTLGLASGVALRQ